MAALRTIAVGYDGSSDSAAAVIWAAELAVAVGAQLLVVHAVGLLEAADFSQHPDASAALNIVSSVGMEPERAEWLILDGDPCSVLLRAASPPISANLLVVGSRGTGKHSGTPLGSTSLELVETAVTPVAVVPLGEE